SKRPTDTSSPCAKHTTHPIVPASARMAPKPSAQNRPFAKTPSSTKKTSHSYPPPQAHPMPPTRPRAPLLHRSQPVARQWFFGEEVSHQRGGGGVPDDFGGVRDRVVVAASAGVHTRTEISGGEDGVLRCWDCRKHRARAAAGLGQGEFE